MRNWIRCAAFAGVIAVLPMFSGCGAKEETGPADEVETEMESLKQEALRMSSEAKENSRRKQREMEDRIREMEEGPME